MTPGRFLIHLCFCRLPIFFGSIKHEINISDLSNLNLMKLELVLIRHYLRLFIWWIQQVPHSLNMYLKTAHHKLDVLPTFLLSIFLQGLKDHTDRARNKAHHFRCLPSFHCKSLASVSLSIGEDAHTEPVKCTAYHIPYFIKNIILSWLMTENFIKLELDCVYLLGLSPREQSLLVCIVAELVLFPKQFRVYW